MQETNNAEEKEEIYLLPVCFVAFCPLIYFVLIYQKKKHALRFNHHHQPWPLLISLLKFVSSNKRWDWKIEIIVYILCMPLVKRKFIARRRTWNNYEDKQEEILSIIYNGKELLYNYRRNGSSRRKGKGRK